MQVSNLTQLNVEFLFSTPDFCRIEHQLHILMAKQRIRGEWFHIKLVFDYEGLIKQVQSHMRYDSLLIKLFYLHLQHGQ